MKTQLTAEESAKLIELGVSPERASEAVYCAVKKSFESIFGKEMFEKEGE